MKDGTQLSVSVEIRKRRSEVFLIAAQRAFLYGLGKDGSVCGLGTQASRSHLDLFSCLRKGNEKAAGSKEERFRK